MCKVEKKIGLYGNIFWYKRGTNILHREDGPAIEHIDGAKYWFQNGKRHRLDGPAMEYSNGKRKYYIDDKFIGVFSAELIKYKESYLINV